MRELDGRPQTQKYHCLSMILMSLRMRSRATVSISISRKVSSSSFSNTAPFTPSAANLGMYLMNPKPSVDSLKATEVNTQRNASSKTLKSVAHQVCTCSGSQSRGSAVKFTRNEQMAQMRSQQTHHAPMRLISSSKLLGSELPPLPSSAVPAGLGLGRLFSPPASVLSLLSLLSTPGWGAVESSFASGERRLQALQTNLSRAAVADHHVSIRRQQAGPARPLHMDTM